MHAHAIARIAKNRFEQGARAALAVGARHRKDGALEFDAHARNHFLHALEPEIHRFFMDF